MDHAFFKDRISSYHDAQLSNDEQLAVEEHLASCAECRELLSELQRIDKFVEDNSMPGESNYWDSAAARIDQAIAAADDAKDIKPVTPMWKGLGWKITAVAASVALLTFISLHESDISDQQTPVEKTVTEMTPPSIGTFDSDDVMSMTDADRTTSKTKANRPSEPRGEKNEITSGATGETKNQLEGLIGTKVESSRKKISKPVPIARAPRSEDSPTIKSDQFKDIVEEESNSSIKEEVLAAEETDVLAETLSEIGLADSGVRPLQRAKLNMESLASEPVVDTVDELVAADEIPDSLRYWESQLSLLTDERSSGKSKSAITNQLQTGLTQQRPDVSKVSIAQCYYQIARLTRESDSLRYDQAIEWLKKQATDSSNTDAKEAKRYIRQLNTGQQ